MRFTAALLLVVLAGFAGCSDDGDEDGGDGGIAIEGSNHPLDGPTAAFYHSPPRELGGNATDALVVKSDLATVPVGASYYLPVSTFEPTIGSDPDGCLFFTHFLGTGTGTRIYMSCDQGLSWEEIGPDLPLGALGPCFPSSNDPYVHVDRDTGRVFASDLHALVSSTLHYTDDKGAAWQCNPGGGGTPPGVHDHQTVATGAPRTVTTVGYPNVVYYCVNRVADSVCSSSLDGGVGFGPLIPVYPGVEAPSEDNDCEPDPSQGLNCVCGGLHGHVETDHEGRVLLPKGQCGRPEVAVSEDDGLTWSRSVVSGTTGVMGHEVRVAADEADNLYAFYVGADGLPYLARSTDHGDTWQDAWMVAPPGVTATGFPAVYAAGEDRVAFAYVGMTAPGGYDSAPENMTWNGYLGVIEDASQAHPLIATVSVNDPSDPLDRSRPCGAIRCGGLGDFIDLTITPEGRPYAAFGDNCLDECAEPGAAQNSGGLGLVGTFRSGPSLWDGSPLAPLAPQPGGS